MFRGTLRKIVWAGGMMNLLWKRQVLLKDFGPFAESVTERLKAASCQVALDRGRPVIYLPSAATNKEETARRIADRDKVSDGLICILSALELCRSYSVFKNRDTKKLELRSTPRKGLSLYHYFIDPFFGFMYARIRTWFPFDIQIGINGREWLARQLDREGVAYRRSDNCFPWIADVDRAQRLMDRLLAVSWPRHLDALARQINPAHSEIFRDFPARYYWSVPQSEWATDLLFKDSSALAHIYPGLVRHAMTAFSSTDVLRFLGRKVHGNFEGEVLSDFKHRAEGVRIKHRVGVNSVKLYDKQGSVLRAETTLNDPKGFKAYRRKEGEPHGELAWRTMRKGVADLHRRANVSQDSNERYLDALTVADTSTSLGDLLLPLCRPLRWKGQRVRGLRPWSPDDLALFQAVCRGEFSVNGFRNRDLQRLLFQTPPSEPKERRRRSAQITRRLRMLRAHGLIRKIPASRRYLLTNKGRDILSVVLTAQRVTLQQLNTAAA
ncbi:MAG: hypothetical protein A3G75_11940 [Verrucomicrobia bacterium RIFCSPLOWO2_12_FULL_64_8]|nr:MAG: hypothetical protein A3G75_11940 [Verrucomicrobia bacterium RIFCSPLOWO2_12_FULL_64_8]